MQTQGYDMKDGSQNICIVYRVCFKAMTSIQPNSKFISKKGNTTLFQVDTNKANIQIPKTIKWSEIELPQSWKLEKIIPPKIIKRTTKTIIENSDGDVEIIFGINSTSTRYTTKENNASGSNVAGIIFSEQQIPHGLYTNEPSSSEMEFRINMTKYEPKRRKCSKEFMQPRNKNFRNWYFQTFNNDQLKNIKKNIMNI